MPGGFVPVVVAGDGPTRPSAILGSDLLNLFPGYAVDFPRRELPIKPPPAPPKGRPQAFVKPGASIKS